MNTQLLTYGIYVALLIVAGAAEYLKLAPSGTFLPMLTLVVGHFFGNAPVTGLINQNTQALKDNTQATQVNTTRGDTSHG